MKKRADGRYVKVITDPKTHKRISFYGNTVREVNQKLLEYERKQENGKTFEEAADEWWEETENSLASQTVGGYKVALRRATEHFRGDYLTDIAPRHIQAFLKALAAQQFATKTISNHFIVVKQIFDYSVVSGYIDHSPCISIKLPKGSGRTTRDPATLEDEQRIIESDHPWLFPLVALLTGLRRGEILALQWKDIDFEENTIEVTKSVEFIHNRPYIKCPKTENGYRTVPLIDLLKDRLVPSVTKPHHFIFSDDGGKSPLCKQRFADIYNKYAKDVGITCTAHQLRHSYATIAVEEDVNPKDLQNALGHANISTTMNIYAAARKRSVEKVAAKLNERYKH